MIWLRGSTVEVEFADAKLHAACSSERQMTRKWGKSVAAALKKSLASLDAAETLAILETAPGRCHHLSGDRRGQFAIHLSKVMRLVFVPSNDPLPKLPDGGLDRHGVTRVRVLEVTDYHE